MLKKSITYVDFNDVERTEDFYFNLSKTELTEMQASVDGGLTVVLDRIVKTESTKEMIPIFKSLIISSFGIKSDDGKRFVKDEQIAKDFVSSPAFDVLFMEMMTDANKFAEFIKGIIPQDIRGEFEAQFKNAAELTAVPSRTEG